MAKKKKTGRHGKYHEWLTEDGLDRIESWARDGLTDEQMAKNMGISRTTFYDWKNKHPNIADALKSGKQPVDFEVENALLKNAMGFEYEETETFISVDANGKETRRVIKHKRYSKPDTTAQIFWLKNRKPDVWQRTTSNKAEKERLEQERLEAQTALAKQQARELNAETDFELVIADSWSDEDDD